MTTLTTILILLSTALGLFVLGLALGGIAAPRPAPVGRDKER